MLLTNTLATSRTSSAESILAGTGLVDQVSYYPGGKSGLKQIRDLMALMRDLKPAALIYLADRLDAASVYRDLCFFKAAGVPKILGLPGTKRLRVAQFDPATGELEYEVVRLARTLEGVMPVRLLPEDWDLHLSASELAKADAALRMADRTPPMLALAPGARVSEKDWGVENWIKLVTTLAPLFPAMTLVTVGGPDERALCDQVVAGWRGPVRNLCGDLTPRETAAVLRHCRLMVCHDSGPMHLAASQQLPVVALFGNYNLPHRWYPFGAGHSVIYQPRGIRQISVAQVAAKVQRALNDSALRQQQVPGSFRLSLSIPGACI